MQQWEYLFVQVQAWSRKVTEVNQVEEITPPAAHDYANRLGADGWELVGVGFRHGLAFDYDLIFKRPKA